MKKVCVIAAVYLAAALPAAATDTRSYGGNGGGQFRTVCGRGAFLVGIAGRNGSWVDAIRPICADWDPATKSRGTPVEGPMSGGSGGGAASLMCPQGTAIKGVEVVAIDNGGQVLVRYVQPRCLVISQEPSGAYLPTHAYVLGGGGPGDGSRTDSFDCPKGEMANGVHGRSGAYLDRVGLTCAPVPFVLGRPVTVPSIGKVDSLPAQGGASAASAARLPPTTDTLQLGQIPQRARGVTYNSPMIVAANGQTVMLDFCREWGSACGKPAADAFCRLKGYPDASRFQISEDIGQTAIISSGAICADPSCDGFTKIQCNP